MFKTIALAAATMSAAAMIPAFAQDERRRSVVPQVTVADVQAVSPALAKYLTETVLGEVWQRPGLSPRDRGVITVAALIARNQTVEMPFYFERALDSGVTRAELSEIITHLAFYAGFPNAISAVVATKDVFDRRGVGADQLPQSCPSFFLRTGPSRPRGRRS